MRGQIVMMLVLLMSIVAAVREIRLVDTSDVVCENGICFFSGVGDIGILDVILFVTAFIMFCLLVV